MEVLLIEESTDFADFLREILSHATDTRFGLVHLRGIPATSPVSYSEYSLILLGAAEEKQAIEAVAATRSLMPGLPIIVLTEGFEREHALRVLKAGAEDCLFKHEVLDGVLLWRSFQYAIERHRLHGVVQRTARELQAREETFRKMIEMQADAILIVDTEGMVRYANPAAEILFGRRAEQLLDTRFEHPVSPGRTTPAKIPVCVDDHIEVRRAEIRAVDIDWQGKPAVLASVRDITESVEKEAEALRTRQLELVGMLSGGIAHDLNNFLTSMYLNVHLALRVAGGNERLREILSDMQKALPRASDLTRQLLTFSKSGSPVRSDTELADLIRDTASFSLRGSNVRCELLLQDNLWKVLMDPGQVSQILNNLIVNANQAMVNGGTLRIHAENMVVDGQSATAQQQGVSEGSYVHLRVQDQGPGISPEHLSRIFQAYFTTKKNGNGLGLATCHAILEHHGGHIHVDSRLGAGSCFHVYLPVVEVPATREAPAQAPRQPRILFMDDEKDICKVVARVLDDMGLEVEFAGDGFEAVQKFERACEAGNPFDAVILDVTVPGGMGAERTIQRLLAIDPELKAIASSAYVKDPVIRHPELYGFKARITKPYDIGELCTVLQSLGVEVQLGPADSDDSPAPHPQPTPREGVTTGPRDTVAVGSTGVWSGEMLDGITLACDLRPTVSNHAPLPELLHGDRIPAPPVAVDAAKDGAISNAPGVDGPWAEYVREFSDSILAGPGLPRLRVRSDGVQ